MLFTDLRRKNLNALWNTEMRKSRLLRPSSVCVIFLGIGASFFLPNPESKDQKIRNDLIHSGWSAIEGISCPHLHRESFYEVDFGKNTREIYIDSQGLFLSSLPLPQEAEEANCQKISKPSHVEEL